MFPALQVRIPAVFQADHAPGASGPLLTPPATSPPPASPVSSPSRSPDGSGSSPAPGTCPELPFLRWEEALKAPVCSGCSQAVVPAFLEQHLLNSHQIQAAKARQAALAWLRAHCDPTQEVRRVVRGPRAPIPGLAILPSHFLCRECPSHSPTIYRGRSPLYQHLREVHHLKIIIRAGCKPKNSRELLPPEIRKSLPYQRPFATGGLQGLVFEVIVPPEASISTPGASVRPDSSLEIPGILPSLGEALGALRAEREKVVIQPLNRLEAAAWLERTAWPEFLRGQEPRNITPLVERPRDDEPLLLQWEASLTRLISRAKEAVLAEEIDIFSQHLASFFKEQRTREGHQLKVKLQGSTYRNYIAVWARFLAYIYRCSFGDLDPGRREALKFRLTESQANSLDRARISGHDLLDWENDRDSEAELASGSGSGALEALNEELDKAVCTLCLDLLRQTITGNRFEAAILSFLGVLGLSPIKVSAFQSRSPRLGLGLQC